MPQKARNRFLQADTPGPANHRENTATSKRCWHNLSESQGNTLEWFCI
jgi:hypothetical protein